MKLINYNSEHKESCLSIFDSNVGKYFAEWERAEFETFLAVYTEESSYFVVQEYSNIVACGGFENEEGVVALNWGMVKRDLHGTSIDKFLTKSRLALIEHEFRDSTVNIQTSQHTKGFYEEFGFRVTRVKKDGYDLGLDKIYMEYNVNH